MYSVYVLRSQKDDNLYIGCTSNLKTRLEMHKQGKVFSTKHRRPLGIVYKEEYADKYEAFKRERFYKTAVGKRELLKRIKNCPIV